MKLEISTVEILFKNQNAYEFSFKSDLFADYWKWPIIFSLALYYIFITAYYRLLWYSYALSGGGLILQVESIKGNTNCSWGNQVPEIKVLESYTRCFRFCEATELVYCNAHQSELG